MKLKNGDSEKTYEILITVLDRVPNKEYTCDKCLDYGFLIDLLSSMLGNKTTPIVVCDCKGN